MNDSPSFLFRRFGPAPVMLIGWLAWVSTVRAGSGGFGELPDVDTPARSGVALRVDTQWLGDNGYRPVRVTLEPLGTVPTPRARLFCIELTQDRYTTTADIEMPQGTGAAGVTKTILLAEGGAEDYGSFMVTVSENGAPLRDLCGFISRLNHQDRDVRAPAILFVDDDAPSLRQQWLKAQQGNFQSYEGEGGTKNQLPNLSTLFSVFAPDYESQSDATWSDLATLREVASWPGWRVLSTADLPDQWQALSSVDLVMISRERLEAIRKNRPEKFEALLQWNQAGGTLVVSGGGDEYETLPAIEKMLQLSAGPESVRPDSIPADDRRWPGWRRPDPEQYGQYDWRSEDPRTGANFNFSGGPSQVVLQAAEEAIEEAAEEAAEAAEQTDPSVPLQVQTVRQKGYIDHPPFLIRGNLTGLVVVLAAENPYPGEADVWNWMFAGISEPRLYWVDRHGFDKCGRNSDYWRFFMPEVGLPPVTGFRVLITVFAILIGPVNFWVLGRRKRLHLLVLTVPAGALLVTVGLFAYALLADGLGVKARLRSYTELDQRTGRAVCWSRQAYFAGIVPSAGLQYPLEAAVYPIYPSAFTSRLHPHYVWGERQQVKSVLPPRTIGQVMVVYPQKTKIGLEIVEPAVPATPKVVNHLGTEIERLWIRGKDGRLWQLEQLAPDASAEASPCEAPAALAHWDAQWENHRLGTPEGIDLDEFNRYGGYQYYYYSQDQEPNGDESILEKNLEFPDRFGLVSTIRSPQLHQVALEDLLPPGEYLAWVRRPPTVPVGIEKIEEKNSLHVIRGKW